MISIHGHHFSDKISRKINYVSRDDFHFNLILRECRNFDGKWKFKFFEWIFVVILVAFSAVIHLTISSTIFYILQCKYNFIAIYRINFINLIACPLSFHSFTQWINDSFMFVHKMLPFYLRKTHFRRMNMLWFLRKYNWIMMIFECAHESVCLFHILWKRESHFIKWEINKITTGIQFMEIYIQLELCVHVPCNPMAIRNECCSVYEPIISQKYI